MIDTIIENQLRKQNASEADRLNREKKYRNKNKEGTSKPSTKKGCFVNKKPKQVKQKVTPIIQILMQTQHYGV